MIISRFKLSAIIVFAALLAGCSTTHIKSVWKDPSYVGHPQKIMVVAVAKEPIYRRLFEDEFVLQLKARGTDAIASYSTLPDKSQDDQAAIAKMVQQLGADTVLVSRMVSKRIVRIEYPDSFTHRPYYYGRWPDYYRRGYDLIYMPGYTTNYEYALVETNLYNSHDDKLIWAATTETGVENFNQAHIKPYIGTILKTMSLHGFIRE